MVNKLDLTDLESLVANETGIVHVNVKAVLKSFLDHLTQGVAIQGYAEIHGLGSFKLKKRKARSGTDPNGKTYQVGERYTVDFNAFSTFRDHVEQVTGIPCIE